jgi:hypothetical protein
MRKVFAVAAVAALIVTGCEPADRGGGAYEAPAEQPALETPTPQTTAPEDPRPPAEQMRPAGPGVIREDTLPQGPAAEAAPGP